MPSMHTDPLMNKIYKIFIGYAIEDLHNETTHLVTSDSLSREIVPKTHTIIKGVCTFIRDVCDALRQSINEKTVTSSFSKACHGDDQLNRSIVDVNSSLIYTNIFKNILLAIEFQEKQFKFIARFSCEYQTKRSIMLHLIILEIILVLMDL